MQTQQTTQSEIKSRKVRRILKLEARAQKLRARYDKAMEKLEPLRRRLEELQKDARSHVAGARWLLLPEVLSCGAHSQ